MNAVIYHVPRNALDRAKSGDAEDDVETEVGPAPSWEKRVRLEDSQELDEG